ncbi:MAG: SCO family protein [Chloroflexota bacterium]
MFPTYIRLFLLIILIGTLLSSCENSIPSDDAQPQTEVTPTSIFTTTPTSQPVSEPTPHSFHGLQYDPIEPAPDFELIDHEGSTVRLSDLQGKVVLLYFGFLNCPDACPMTFATWQQAYKRLKTNDNIDTNDLRFVFISVDPERDSPQLIRDYLDIFDPDFMGLWGTVDEVEDIARSYNVFMQKVETDSAMGYLVNHTTLTFVIDPNGDLVLAHQIDINSQELMADLTALLP